MSKSQLAEQEQSSEVGMFACPWLQKSWRKFFHLL